MMRGLAYLAVGLVAPLLAQPLLAAETKDAKRVLIVYSLDKDHPAHQLTDLGINAVFRGERSLKIEAYSEYLDVGRFQGAEHAGAMADLLRRKYAAVRIDTIITVYPDASDLLLGEKEALFPGVPIVAAEVPRSYGEALERSPARPRITAVVVGDNASGIVADVLRLKPRTRRFALVGGSTQLDVYDDQLFREALKKEAGPLEVIDLTRLSMEETLSKVGTLPPDAVVLYGSIIRDGAGQNFTPRDALARLSRVTSVPIFGLYDTYLGYGIVGGHLVSFERQGKIAAAMALRLMAGASPGEIRLAGEDAHVDLYDWRELERWNIPETAIPEGSELRYRAPSFWKAYRWLVVGTLVLVGVETVLVLVLLVNVRRRREAERSLRSSEERVRLATDAAGAGLWSLDREGRVVWASDKALDLYGLPKGVPLTLEQVLETIHPDDLDRVRDSARRAWETGEEVYLEYQLVAPDDSPRWIAVRCGISRPGPNAAPLLTGVSVDVTERKKAEEEMRRNEQQLTILAGRLIHNQEEELRRLSRELHDDLTQRLTSLAIEAGLQEKAVRALAPSSADAVREMKTRLIEASNEVHDLSRRLHPSILDDLGVVHAARAECDTFRRRTGIDLAFEAGEITAPLSRDASLCLYRVLQEALQNIAKHSGARDARASLEERADGFVLTVRDFGVGFDVHHVSRGGGVGLSSMRERARLVGGRVAIASRPGKGTEVEVTVPRGGAQHVQA